MHVPLSGHCKNKDSDRGFIPSGSAMGRSHVREKLGPAQDLRMTGASLCARVLHAASSCFRLWHGGRRGRFLKQRGPEKGQGDVVRTLPALLIL